LETQAPQRTDAMNARTYFLGLRDRIPNGHQFVPVAVAVDMREPYGQLMAESWENSFNNWPLVGTGGNEMPLLAAGLTMICGQWPAPITNRLLKNDFLTTFSCKNPNDFEGQFFKTRLFQQPAKVLGISPRTSIGFGDSSCYAANI